MSLSLPPLAVFVTGLLALIAAVVLANLWVIGRINRRWPVIGTMQNARGVAAHVITTGTPTQGVADVLLVHGAASNARELIGALGDKLTGLRLIAPDRPGLGHSGRPDGAQTLGVQAAFIADIVRQNASGPVVAVGHSWGSGVVLRLALDHPELVKALVLLAPASHPWQAKTALMNRIANWPILGPLLVWTLPPLLGPLLAPSGIARGFAPGPVKPENYGALIGTPLYFRPHSYQANAADMTHGSAEMGLQAPRYSGLSLPVTIISGQGDIIVYNAIHAAGLARDIAHAKTYRIMGAGHMPHWVAPDFVADIITAHAHGQPHPDTSAQFRAEG